MSRLIITADDYGYAPEYNRGIVEAARAGAVDAVSAMVEREWCDPAPLLAVEVEIGLHLELPPVAGRATDVDRRDAERAVEAQLRAFTQLFGRTPTHIDGHRHCHAASGLANVVARVAGEQRVRVRSIDARHRRLLRCLGVSTPDLLIGRLSETEPVLPAELDALPAGVTEWMVHPGYGDERSRSSYDAGREEDLRVLLARKRAAG